MNCFLQNFYFSKSVILIDFEILSLHCPGATNVVRYMAAHASETVRASLGLLGLFVSRLRMAFIIY